MSHHCSADMLKSLIVCNASEHADNAAEGVLISYARNVAMSGIPMIAKLMIQACFSFICKAYSCRNMCIADFIMSHVFYNLHTSYSTVGSFVTCPWLAVTSSTLPWLVGLLSDKDKSKAARVQTLLPAQPLTSYATSEAKSVPVRTEVSQRGTLCSSAVLRYIATTMSACVHVMQA